MGRSRRSARKVIRVSVDQHVHRGWSMDYQGLPPADVYMLCEPDVAVPMLARGRAGAACGCFFQAGTSSRTQRSRTLHSCARRRLQRSDERHGDLPLQAAARLERRATGISAIRSTISAPMAAAGGRGPGLTVGAALALKGNRRMVVGICGDGDFLMGVTAAVDRGALQAAVPASSSPTTAPSTTTRCTRSAWRRSAAGRWRTSGSASASTSPTSISR